MIKKYIFAFFLIFSVLFQVKAENVSIEESMKKLENELLYGITENEIKILDTNFLNKLYKKKKSNVAVSSFSKNPVIFIFNEDFENISLSKKEKEYIFKNKRKNFFIPPNIIHLSSSHNKSFAYSFYRNKFYQEPLKSYTQHILLFHELAHYYIFENINFEEEFSQDERQAYKFRAYIEESYSDLFSILFLTKTLKIPLENINMFFDGLIKYRDNHNHYSYVSNYSLEIFKIYYFENYENIHTKTDKEIAKKLYSLNKKILSYNYKNIINNFFPEYKTKNTKIDIKNFFKILNKEKYNKNIKYEDIKNIFL